MSPVSIAQLATSHRGGLSQWWTLRSPHYNTNLGEVSKLNPSFFYPTTTKQAREGFATFLLLPAAPTPLAVETTAVSVLVGLSLVEV